MCGAPRAQRERAFGTRSFADLRRRVRELLRWRRDVRRFRPAALPDGKLHELLREVALTSPSVGLSQPWRFVIVEDPAVRERVRENFADANAEALRGYVDERAQRYAQLKLDGLSEAPAQVAVFVDESTTTGAGLGRRTMPETLAYSAVAAVHALWLLARADGIGIGWVSILDPERLARDLDAPESWRLIAYLCIGYPLEEHVLPELERAGWEQRLEPDDVISLR